MWKGEVGTLLESPGYVTQAAAAAAYTTRTQVSTSADQ